MPQQSQVRWFERICSEQPSLPQHQDREVLELEDCDVNPIGCVYGKATVLRVKSLEEVRLSHDWHTEGEEGRSCGF
jgi:hypothetical protein